MKLHYAGFEHSDWLKKPNSQSECFKKGVASIFFKNFFTELGPV